MTNRATKTPKQPTASDAPLDHETSGVIRISPEDASSADAEVARTDTEVQADPETREFPALLDSSSDNGSSHQQRGKNKLEISKSQGLPDTTQPMRTSEAIVVGESWESTAEQALMLAAQYAPGVGAPEDPWILFCDLLVRHHREEVVKDCRKHFRNEALGQDACQNAIEYFFSGRQLPNDLAHAKRALVRIARNKAVDLTRRARVRKAAAYETDPYEEFSASASPVKTSPEASMDLRRYENSLTEPEDRADFRAVQFREIMGYEWSEVAGYMGESVDTVRYRVTRGKLRLSRFVAAGRAK